MKKSILSAAIATTLLLSGCEELEKLCGFTSAELGFSQDYTKQFDAATYIYQQTDRALRDSDLAVPGAKEIDGAQCTRTIDSLIIDYGNGAVGSDGVIRKGAIRVAVVGDYLLPNGSAHASLVDYSQSNTNYTGSFTLANTTTGTVPQITVGVSEFAADSTALNANLMMDWVSGFATQNTVADDVFEISGTAVLTNTNTNDNFTGNLVSPIRIDASCPYVFVSGVIDLVPSNTALPTVGIDFIDGNCENLFQAKLSCEGNEFSFSYPIK